LYQRRVGNWRTDPKSSARSAGESQFIQALNECKRLDDISIATKRAGALTRANGYLYRLAPL